MFVWLTALSLGPCAHCLVQSKCSSELMNEHTSVRMNSSDSLSSLFVYSLFTPSTLLYSTPFNTAVSSKLSFFFSLNALRTLLYQRFLGTVIHFLGESVEKTIQTCSATKKGDILLFATTWMDLEGVISQTRRTA